MSYAPTYVLPLWCKVKCHLEIVPILLLWQMFDDISIVQGGRFETQIYIIPKIQSFVNIMQSIQESKVFTNIKRPQSQQ